MKKAALTNTINIFLLSYSNKNYTPNYYPPLRINFPYILYLINSYLHSKYNNFKPYKYEI